MDLWIRSQDKELLMLINTLALAEDEIGSIIGYGIDGKMKSKIGEYKTKERALEVLDEIQRTIVVQLVNRHKQLDGNYSFEVINTAIYEMPKD